MTQGPPLSEEFDLKVENSDCRGLFTLVGGSIFDAQVIITPFPKSDSSNKTVLNFQNDSIHLRKWNSDFWKGKGMLGYDQCECSLNGDT